MKVIIGFSKPKNKMFPWFSWLIRLFQNTQYSHCYLKIPLDGIDEVMTFQASGLQVNMVGNEYFNEFEQPVFEYQLVAELSETTRKKLLEFIFSNLGKPYGLSAIVKIVWFKLFKSNLFGSSNEDQSSWVCSEIIACALEDVLNVDMGIDFTEADPRDIQMFLSSSPLVVQTFPKK